MSLEVLKKQFLLALGSPPNIRLLIMTHLLTWPSINKQTTGVDTTDYHPIACLFTWCAWYLNCCHFLYLNRIWTCSVGELCIPKLLLYFQLLSLGLSLPYPAEWRTFSWSFSKNKRNSRGLCSEKSQAHSILNVILEGSWTTFPPSSALDSRLRNTGLDNNAYSSSVIP